MNLDEMLAEEELELNPPIQEEGEETPEEVPAESTETIEEDDEEDAPASDPDAVAYFNYLKEVQVLDVPDDFEFNGTTEGIQKALETTRQNLTAKVANHLWNTLPDDFKPLLEYGLNGGKSLDEFLAVNKPIPPTLDLEDEISRRTVVKSYYQLINPNFDEAKIDRMIDRLAEIGDLKDEAQDAVEYLNSYKTEKQQELISRAAAAKEAENQRILEQNATITQLIESSKDFDSNRKNRLKQFALAPVKEGDYLTTAFDSTLETVISNPNHFVQLADILADYDPRVGFNFDRIRKKLKTETTQSFKELINKQLDTKTPVSGSNKQVNEDFNWEQYLASR